MIKMEDIARIAGVSRSAVSLTINDKPGVGPKTREKIFKVIAENDYQPLRKRHKGKSHYLASVTFLIITNHQGMVKSNYRSLPFFDNLISALSKNISAYGGTTQVQNIESRRIKKDIPELIKDGLLKNTVVLATDLSRQQIQYLKDELKTVVFVDTYYDDVSADFVTMDNFQGAYDAAEYILNKGYKKIGYVASDRNISNFQNRRRGFYQAMKLHNREILPEHFYSISPLMKGADENEIVNMLQKSKSLPDALFCEDDYIAVRLIKELSNLNVKIPEKVAIMGFDDIYVGQMISPELTTVHVPIHQIVNQVLFQLQEQRGMDNWQPQKCLVATRIVERHSL